MWIEIKKDIFANADFRALNFLLQILSWYPKESIPRYKILVNYTQVEDLENYTKLAKVNQEIIERDFDEAITHGILKGKNIVSNSNNQAIFFNIEEAIQFLNQPVSIVLENSLNDSYFLRAIFKHFKINQVNGKNELEEFVKNKWIRFVNAGGWTNIRNYVKGEEKSFDTLSKTNSDYLRLFVMIDSDREYSTKVIQDKEDLKTELEAKGIKVHILKKRAMENYMPDEVIQRIPTIKPVFKGFEAWVNAYTHLNDEQKDYLNYQKGFSKNTREEEIEEIRHLYADVSNPNYAILAEGLGFPKFKDNFPMFFQDSHQVHHQSLLKRVGGTKEENEFLEILEKIKELI